MAIVAANNARAFGARERRIPISFSHWGSQDQARIPSTFVEINMFFRNKLVISKKGANIEGTHSYRNMGLYGKKWDNFDISPNFEISELFRDKWVISIQVGDFDTSGSFRYKSVISGDSYLAKRVQAILHLIPSPKT
jgi:hypothetical protein